MLIQIHLTGKILCSFHITGSSGNLFPLFFKMRRGQVDAWDAGVICKVFVRARFESIKFTLYERSA